jgi:predicted membrane protein
MGVSFCYYVGCLYRVYRSNVYRAVMFIALMLLMLLVFWEPAPYESKDEGPVWTTTADVLLHIHPTYVISH